MPRERMRQHTESNIFMKILRMIPLMLLVLISYFVVVLLGAGEATIDNPDPVLRLFTDPWFSVTLPSTGKWSFTLEHLFIVVALFFLFFEIVKSTSIGGAAIAEMAISTLVFIIFLVSFLIVKDASTSLFFILMVISLIDVLGGYIIGIKVARRDLAIGGGLM